MAFPLILGGIALGEALLDALVVTSFVGSAVVVAEFVSDKIDDVAADSIAKQLRRIVEGLPPIPPNQPPKVPLENIGKAITTITGVETVRSIIEERRKIDQERFAEAIEEQLRRLDELRRAQNGDPAPKVPPVGVENGAKTIQGARPQVVNSTESNSSGDFYREDAMAVLFEGDSAETEKRGAEYYRSIIEESMKITVAGIPLPRLMGAAWHSKLMRDSLQYYFYQYDTTEEIKEGVLRTMELCADRLEEINVGGRPLAAILGQEFLWQLAKFYDFDLGRIYNYLELRAGELDRSFNGRPAHELFGDINDLQALVRKLGYDNRHLLYAAIREIIAYADPVKLVRKSPQSLRRAILGGEESFQNLLDTVAKDLELFD